MSTLNPDNRHVDLTPSEQDRLLIFTAAQLAQSRRERGLLLNVPEATALMCHAVIESARDGASHADAMRAGLNAVTQFELLPGVASLLQNIAVEAVFDDGRRLVVLNFETDDSHSESQRESQPGEVTRLTAVHVEPHTDVVTLTVTNESSINISVTTHMHFFEVNPRLHFNREQAYGRHLYIPSGEHVDFPARVPVEVNLIPIRGNRIMIGFAGLVDGPLDEPGMKEQALERARDWGYLGSDQG